MKSAILGLVVVALACGGSGSNAKSSGSSTESVGGSCGAIAAEYSAAFPDAVICDPSVQDPCGAEYPLAAKQGSSAADAVFTGLCIVAYVGYVNPARTAGLDAALAKYSAAGCQVGYCPGPGPHPTLCLDNGRGAFTCGGQ